MADQLEDFIRKNRSAFDTREPNEKAWTAIEQSLPGKRVTLFSQVNLWRTAAVFFMAVSAYLFASRYDAGQSQDNRLAWKEFHDVESFYVEQIAMKESLIDDFRQAEGLNGFTMDFKQLEAMYSVLKEEMKVRPSQKVKDALILNLLVRMDLLNQQLHKIETQEETEETQEEETPDTKES